MTTLLIRFLLAEAAILSLMMMTINIETSGLRTIWYAALAVMMAWIAIYARF